MEDGNNIKKYSAADIEKYHTGQLSPKEMHDLEKAALDDPFLADAMEGYAVTGVNAAADLSELKKRLAAKTQTAKVVKMGSSKTGFPWLKAAAMIVVLVGAGLLVYQLGFNKKSENIAQTKQKEELKTTDTILITAPSVVNSGKDTSTTLSDVNIGTVKTNATPVTITLENSGSGLFSNDSKADTSKVVSGYKDIATNSPVAPGKISGNIPAPNEKKEQKADDAIAKEDVKNKSFAAKKEGDADGVADKADKNRQQSNEEFAKRGIVNNSRSEKFQQQKDNYFRGRVTDANNNAVPFANITSTRDNGGTYADARGYFNLVSPDTVIDVQVRSVGFENNQSQLRNSVADNQVVLQNDRSLQEVVISAKKPNAEARKINAPVKVEEPEPADGWENYDTYLSNNLKTPDEFKTRESGGSEVKVSFEVDKYGEPINIKIEKSLCSSCDKEAIRLVKEGPKWKRKARKGRTTVTISF